MATKPPRPAWVPLSLKPAGFLQSHLVPLLHNKLPRARVRNKPVRSGWGSMGWGRRDGGRPWVHYQGAVVAAWAVCEKEKAWAGKAVLETTGNRSR